MAFSSGYTIGFATAVCLVCSLSIASVSVGLKERQDDNKRRDLQSNILGALGLPEDGHDLVGEEIDQLWAARVDFRVIDPSGALVVGADGDRDGDGDLDEEDVLISLGNAEEGAVPDLCSLYVRKDGDKEASYAIPMMGDGLWGPITGYLALNPEATLVTGVTFFAPKETPGLGAEIQNAKFKDQWVGKKVVDSTGKGKTIQVVKGAADVLCPGETDWCVDGVSGATITSRGVDVMVAQSLDWYDNYLITLRGR
ncbi:MAG: NADH:ubiquinone reductase (Na(+)-transporting) subunit C [Rhodobacterales bacterium]|nr:NADH:ubiquinone reductase (Na(+)-transporting) subunit C [Rhodobacterales bacterium]